MKIKIVKKGNRGFALLFSVLVSSLLLTIGLSILNISLKELAISNSSKQSIRSFYAADSGREYTLYHDTKIGDASTFNVDNQTAQPDVITYLPVDALTGGIIPVDSEDASGPNFSVKITKNWADVGTYSKISTTIDSVGHDSDGGDRVERAIQQTY